jgi:hypothetical protein
MKRIIITVEDATGELTVKGDGFKGKECEKALEKITSELGTVTKSCKLPEYFQTAVTQQKVVG